ncbi:MAG: hypothetical protein K0Q49_1999 [Haloplasmataceae bacterium]|nr:hypothetical protein [Haloplasmataceae bacterium]
MFIRKNKIKKLFHTGVETFVNLPEYDFKLHYDYFIHKKSNQEIADLIKLYKTFDKKYDDFIIPIRNISFKSII